MNSLKFRARVNNKFEDVKQLEFTVKGVRWSTLNDIGWFNIKPDAMWIEEVPIPRPIMQFTGLKDKNEKEIYTMDIVKTNITTPFENKEVFGVIEYSDNWGYFGIDFPQYGFSIPISQAEGLEVVGNIFENEDLVYVHSDEPIKS